MSHQKRYGKSSKGRRFIGALACWKRRRFYFVQHNAHDDESVPSNDDQSSEPDRSHVQHMHPTETSSRTLQPTRPEQQELSKTSSADSLQGSIESMDSLVESYWDPGDDTSQATALVSNTGQHRGKDFLDEHLNFLSSQTQPRSVEQVYKT